MCAMRSEDSTLDDDGEYRPLAPERRESRLTVGLGGRLLSSHDISDAEEENASHQSNGATHEPLDPEPPMVNVLNPNSIKRHYTWPTWREFPGWYGRRLIGFDQRLSTYGFYMSWEVVYGGFFTLISLIAMGLINYYVFHPIQNHTFESYIPAFAASCTVVFAVPKAHIAQPRAVVFSHVSAALIGTALTNAFRSVSTPPQPWGQHCASAIGVGLHLALMYVCNMMHPPASATVVSAAINPLNEYFQDEGFFFVLSPVLVGSIMVCICASLLNNLIDSRSPYPQYW